MYRKIQFKGRRIDNNLDVVGFFLGVNPIDFDISFLGLSRGIDYRVHSNSVGQFTGLKTRGKQDLFEGDVFDYTAHDGYLYDDFRGEVMFVDGCFGFINTTVGARREFTPFSEIHELQHDFLNHIQIIGRSIDFPIVTL